MGDSSKAARARDRGALTARELEILALLAAGTATPDIAERLQITPSTVRTHLMSVHRKLGVSNRVQAARHYIDHYDPRPEHSGSKG